MTAVSWDSLPPSMDGQAGYWRERAERAEAELARQTRPTNDGLVEELREAARNHALVAALWPPDSPEHANAIEGDELLSKAADRITALETRPTFEDGLERAAKACEAELAAFSSEEYATNQPIGALSERFACAVCIEAVRALQRNR